eukprot:TRINITY_DN7698_c0_g1_i1.p1 TRINITY_DN7698_c0_g1~~TRINITY_DN7698_c0_g1_i1.p1  ORF type:complete len:609 (+),score=146.13 TRINITY_DN7698_c0_g1_i1:517-2343(+)
MNKTIMDPNSFSNYEQYIAQHVQLSLNVDFGTKVISGTCNTSLLVTTEQCSHFVLDTRGLTIDSVVANDGSELTFDLGGEIEALGIPLNINTSTVYENGSTVSFTITYSTSPDAMAIQWLSPSQTAGKEHPYLFTQCQAIHARSFYPCQDSPQAKTTYTATVSVPAGLTALMSASMLDSKNEDNLDVFSFEQTVPIPSYLMALAVGKLESRSIGPRSTIWSEASMIEQGAWEFNETEKFIKAGEELLGEYVWGTYDILLLPPSFPYGGMENPMLTFVTPTLIAYDRSNVNVLAHEIAHSWTGNLVTNRTWEHFWLNEGFTVFVERKIIGKVYGEDNRHLHAALGLHRLHDSIAHYGDDHDFTCLIPNLSSIDPDDAFSAIPYEKGFNFLWYLENEVVGGPEIFEPFLKSWVQKYSGSQATSEDFKEFFMDYFKANEDTVSLVDWDLWLKTPGYPPVENKFDDTLQKAFLNLVDEWVNSNGENATSEDISNFSPSQIYGFLDGLKTSGHIFSQETLQKMDELYDFTSSRNCEILFRWCRIGLQSEYEPCIEPTIRMLTTQGRMKFTRPLYRELFGSKMGQDVAVSTFLEHRDTYHIICSKMVAKDLNLE